MKLIFYQGETEHMVLALSKEHEGVEICIFHPGVVTNSMTWSRAVVETLFKATNVFTRAFPNIARTQLAAAALDQALHGTAKETISNNELVHIGSEALKATKAA